MFGPLGFQELLFIFALALLIFGPKKLPQIGRTLGRGLAEFRKASNDLRRTINSEMIEQELRDSDPRRAVEDSLQDLKRGLTDEDAAESAGSGNPSPSAPSSASSPSAASSKAPASVAAAAAGSPGAAAQSSGESEEHASSEGAEGVAGAAGTVARGSTPGTKTPGTEASAAEAPIVNSQDDEPTS